jgi:hypothetical protein
MRSSRRTSCEPNAQALHRPDPQGRRRLSAYRFRTSPAQSPPRPLLMMRSSGHGRRSPCTSKAWPRTANPSRHPPASPRSSNTTPTPCRCSFRFRSQGPCSPSEEGGDEPRPRRQHGYDRPGRSHSMKNRDAARATGWKPRPKNDEDDHLKLGLRNRTELTMLHQRVIHAIASWFKRSHGHGRLSCASIGRPRARLASRILAKRPKASRRQPALLRRG